MMKQTLLLLSILTGFAIALQASPPSRHARRTSHKSEEKSSAPTRLSEGIVQSANGWSYVSGKWMHPDGYQYVNGRILRTTAPAGKAAPNPPGKLALENAQKLTARNDPASDDRTAAEKAAEIRRKNLEPRPAPQTGTHL